MSISTKTGDKGQTSLWSGERVSKDDIRVEAYGTIDELDSFISEVRLIIDSKDTNELLGIIQNTLFLVMGELASEQKKFSKPITSNDVDHLTSVVERIEVSIKPKSFKALRNTISSAKLDICRAISRRAERRIIRLSRKSEVSEYIIAYMNRLSDVLYLLARSEELNC